MKKAVLLFLVLLLNTSSVLGFAGPKVALASSFSEKRLATASTKAPALLSAAGNDFSTSSREKTKSSSSRVIPVTALVVLLSLTALPAEAAEVVPTALWAYAHYLSILVITGCLAAERTIVKAGMTVEEEDAIVKIDLVYGLMAALLIISGFARASNFGKGGDYYIHEVLFWIKMSVSGIWGGLSLFPSLTFYKRNFARKNDEMVPPVSEKLAARLQQIINAEISAILTIPLLATLMARGVWYWQDLPVPVGLVTAIVCTGGSFFLYARQALTWTEEDEVVTVKYDK